LAPDAGCDPRAFAAPKNGGRVGWRIDFTLPAGLPQRSDLALLLLGNDRPMVAGSNCGDQKTSISGLRFQDFGFHLRIINP
jgi:hypothetical protein